MKKFVALTALAAVLSPSVYAEMCGDPWCVAPVTSGSTEIKSTRWYTGLIWELGGSITSMTPDLVVGVRITTTKNIDSVRGSDANVRIGLGRQTSLDSIRLTHVGGKPSLLGQIGGGYSFKQKTVVLTGAVQGNHLRLSTDFLLNDGKFQYFGEINTLKKPKRAGTGDLTCPEWPGTEDYTYYLEDAPNWVHPDSVVNGKSCIGPT